MTNPADPDRDPQHRNIVLAVPHPQPLNPRGITITCTMCNAARDWLLVQVRNLVFVRCRCTHEWREHDLQTAHVTAARGNDGEPLREWASFDEMYRGLGFDGLLAGAVWNLA
ncbi:hypothetical protein ACGFX4_24780 [Kitasatospora sp. NPDC048365]|uniref:hypothetical protein n=1 Tax=Kitasatospora sp. NPDC048365 TaxID=3364050 RepID=UPI00371F2371